jgi:cytochrome P450
VTRPAPRPPTAPGRLPVLGHLVQLRARPLDFLQRLRPLGDVVEVRLGPSRAYLVNDTGLVHRVLATDAKKFDKGAFWDKLRPLIGNGVATTKGADHVRQRRMIQPVFHGQRMAGYARTMTAYLEGLAESWRPGQVLSVPDMAQQMTIEIAARTLFSGRLGAAAADAIRRYFPVVEAGVIRRMLVPVALERLPTPGNRRYDEAVRRLLESIVDTVAAYRADGTDQGDLLSLLVLGGSPEAPAAQGDRDTGAAMTDQQIHDEVITLALSASATTAQSLCWAFHQLGQHPDIADRIVAEVREVAGDRPPDYDELTRLDYTGRVVSELLRLYPSWVLMRRTLGPTTLGRYELPAGAQVLISPIAMHRDPSIYPDPLRLDPDRWLSEHAGQIPRHAFIPFGAGSHQCIGSRFAWTELMVALGTLLPRWELRPIPGHRIREKVGVAVQPSSLPMRLVPRTHAHRPPALTE